MKRGLDLTLGLFEGKAIDFAFKLLGNLEREPGIIIGCFKDMPGLNPRQRRQLGGTLKNLDDAMSKTKELQLSSSRYTHRDVSLGQGQIMSHPRTLKFLLLKYLS